MLKAGDFGKIIRYDSNQSVIQSVKAGVHRYHAKYKEGIPEHVFKLIQKRRLLNNNQ